MITAKLSDIDCVKFQIKSCNLTWIVPGVEAMAGAVFLPILTNWKWYLYSLAACWRLSFFVFLKENSSPQLLADVHWDILGWKRGWKSRPEAHQKRSICSNLWKPRQNCTQVILGNKRNTIRWLNSAWKKCRIVYRIGFFLTKSSCSIKYSIVVVEYSIVSDKL